MKKCDLATEACYSSFYFNCKEGVKIARDLWLVYDEGRTKAHCKCKSIS